MHRKSVSALYVFCLLAALPQHPARAQSAEWAKLPGPYCGNVSCVAVDSVSGIMYAGMFDGILRSTDGGRSWYWRALNLQNVRSMYLAQDGTLLVGTGSGIRLSRDHAESWVSDPITGSSVIRAFARSPITGTLIAGANGGVYYRSTDGGSSWNGLSLGGSTRNHFQCMAADAAGTLYAGMYETGVLKSIDDGLHWSRMGEATLPLSILSIAYDETTTTVLTGVTDGIFRSTDAGDSWTPASLPAPFTRKVNDLFALADRVFAGTNAGLFLSTDGGSSWAWDAAFPDSLVADIACNAGTGDVIAGTWNGVYRVLHNSTMWEKIGAPADWIMCLVFDRAGTLYAGTSARGIYTTTDQGETWVHAGLRNMWSIAIDDDRGMLYGGTNGGFYRSSDKGVTWEKVSIDTSSDVFLTVLVLANGHLFAGVGARAKPGGVFHSSDQGAHWEPRNTGITDLDIAWIVEKRTNGMLFAVTPYGDIFRSADTGRSWSLAQKKWGEWAYVTLAVGKTGDLFAGTYGKGIYRSTDDGDSWTAVNNGIPPEMTINGLAVNGDGTVFAGCAPGGVYKSEDNGATWTHFSDGLRDEAHIYSLAADNDGILYAGMYYGGVYRTLRSTLGADRPLPSASVSLPQNHPNPFADRTMISIPPACVPSLLSLKVFDALGREVLDLTSEARTNPTVHVPRTALPASGVYYYRLVTTRHALTRAMTAAN